MNCRFLKFIAFIFLLLMFATSSFAQKGDSDTQVDSALVDEDDSITGREEIEIDTAVTKAIFDQQDDSLQKWKHSPDFGYIMYLDSLLKNAKGLKSDTISIDKSTGKRRRSVQPANENNADNSNNFLNSFPLKIFFWILAVCFIGYIIYKLFIANGLFTKRNPKLASEPREDEPAGLSEYSEYNGFIHEAESKGDFNLSTRYLYLQTLTRLGDHGLIQFSPDKTNHSYVQELSGKIYQQKFASLTLTYEYVWYGKFEINKMQYQQVKEEFVSFNKTV
ncbi:MAG: DUF4129 domain-containing protein [Bacteroidota bacterium]|nr:DUF4129 domain-containing protein [Bacteroidota bacterium]